MTGSFTTTIATNEFRNKNDSEASCKQLELFCKAVVELASANKMVNAVNYAYTDCAGNSLSCKRAEAAGLTTRGLCTSSLPGVLHGTGGSVAVDVGSVSTSFSTSNTANNGNRNSSGKTRSIFSGNDGKTWGSRKERLKTPMTLDRWGRSKSVHHEAHSQENFTSIIDADTCRSQRPRRTHSMSINEKHFVKYKMSKTPHLRKKADFLRSVATENGATSWEKEYFEDVMENVLVWIPQGREDWLDCTDELASLCMEASLRWALNSKSLMLLTASMSSEQRPQPPPEISILVPPTPLSKAYIRERLDIDDPLRGYQIRHAHGGWLQGFIIWTTFTTWTRYFQWNSLHPASEMPTADSIRERRRYDVRGKIAKELEKMSRSGDPQKGGVIWPEIAEIGLVGGLGCGEYLMEMALEDISRQGCYKYVVLQATETSWSFYEKFGFVRIGAVCTYGQSDIVCGYRHWTYADEKNLDTRHGGPSYMMAKKIQQHTSYNCMQPKTGIWEALQSKIVTEKPTVLPWTKQDNYILQHPNPYAPAIMAMMKKGNAWWKKFNSETCNHLMEPKNFLQQPITVTSNPISLLQSSNHDPQKSVTIGQRVVSHTSAPNVSNALSLYRATRFATRSISCDTAKGAMGNCKRRRLDNGTLIRSTTESTTTKSPMKTAIKLNEATPPSQSEAATNLILRTRNHSNLNTQQNAASFLLEKPLCRMDKDRILKQKFTDKPNVKDVNPFFFNKVVTPKICDNSGPTGPYYFVVFYEKKKNKLTVIQLEAYGNFLGRLKHRTRWRAIERDAKDKRSILQVFNGLDYEVVPAEMVTKSSCVHEEGWDILVD